MARPGDQLRADPRRRGACAAALNPPGPGPTNSRNPHGNVTYTEDAWTLITVRYPDVESVRQLLYLGDHIRILNPAEAVEQFHDLAAQIMRAHSTNSSTNVSG